MMQNQIENWAVDGALYRAVDLPGASRRAVAERRAVYGAVDRAVYGAVDRAVYGAVGRVVDRAVYGAVSLAVYRAAGEGVSWAAYEAVYQTVYRSAHHAVHLAHTQLEEPLQPGVGDLLVGGVLCEI